MARREFQTWHLYAAGAGDARPKVRRRGGEEIDGWRDGPDVDEALDRAAAAGWAVFDRERGGARGEQAILHLVREARMDHGAR